MIDGTDTASFQPIGTYDPGAFEIVNVEDPQFEAKVARNNAENRPTDAYVWCYSNDTNQAFFQWAIGKALNVGVTRLWLDYEEEGQEGNWRIALWFQVGDAAGVQTGYYSNDWRVDHRPFLPRPYWYAGYPDPNDGQWRDNYAPRSSRPVQLFQFTSGGGLDRNVVWDEAWFANWVHGQTPTAASVTIPQEDDVPTLVSPNPGVEPARLIWWEGEVLVKGAVIASISDPRLVAAQLSGVGLTGLLNTNKGQPWRVDGAWLASLPDSGTAAQPEPGAPPPDLSGVRAAVQTVLDELAKV